VFHNVKRFGLSAAVRLSAEIGFVGEFTMFSERIFGAPPRQTEDFATPIPAHPTPTAFGRFPV
jgi:hypothetical protein